MSANPLTDELLNELGEEFTKRLRDGQEPSIAEYASRFSGQQATDVADFLDSIAMVESMKSGDDSKSEQSDALPEVFGRYRIERSLGEGGMGAVYLAHDSQLDRKVALKTPKFAKNSDPSLMSRFYREARSAATLQHPNICPVYDVGEIEGIHYISMAYIEGRPLSDYISSKKDPPVSSILKIVRKVAIALHEAHANGVVHRDLKPANIMIDRRNEPIVMDFGLARQFENHGTPLSDAEMSVLAADDLTSAEEQKFEARLTMEGTVVGSPGYMSPEQLFGEHAKIGPASDVYALGVLLYELLTSELPFPGDGTLISIVNSVISDPPPDASIIRPRLDPRLVAISKKAMAKKGQDRFESMLSFAVALTDVLKSSGTEEAGARVSDAASDSPSPELVRTKEQFELAKSLYEERQYPAAVSILEKMVGADQPENRFTAWAKKQLPKAKSRAQADANAIGLGATSLAADRELWTDDVRSENTSRYAQATTRRSRSKKRKKPSLRLKIVAGIMTGGVFLLAAVMIASRLGDAETPRLAESQVKVVGASLTESSAPEVEPENLVEEDVPESRERPFKADRQSPAERLWRFDTNGDESISKAELNNKRIPLGGPLKQISDNFQRYDVAPTDGVLDKGEIQHLLRTLARPGNRENGVRRRPAR